VLEREDCFKILFTLKDQSFFYWFIIYETLDSRELIQTSIVGQLEKCQAEAYATSRRITLFRFTWNHFQGNVRNSTLKLSFFFTRSQKPRLNIRSHSLRYRENCRSSGTNRSEEKWLRTPRINCFLIGGSLYCTSILRSQDLREQSSVETIDGSWPEAPFCAETRDVHYCKLRRITRGWRLFTIKHTSKITYDC